MEAIAAFTVGYERVVNYWNEKAELTVKESNGQVLYYYPNGKIAARTYYNDTYADSKAESWDENGELVEVTYLTKGTLNYIEQKEGNKWIRSSQLEKK